MTYLPPVNGGRINATISGNTTGTGALVSSGTMILAGGNNITLSQAGNAITFSGANAAVGTNTFGVTNFLGNMDTVTGSAVQVLFSGANGISLQGTTNGASISVNVSGPNLGTNSLGMSNIGNTSGTTGMATGTGVQFAFAGGNNITLSQSINGASGTITVSAFNQSNQNITAYGVGNTSISSSATFNANSLVFQGDGNATVALFNGAIRISDSQSNQDLSLYALGNTTQNASTLLNASKLSFNGLGAATVGYSNGSIQLSVPTQTVESQSIGMGTSTAGGGTGGTSGSASGGQIRYNFYAGSNITLSQSLDSIAGASGSLSIYGRSAPAQTVQPGIQSIQVSNTTYTTGNVIFSNANGVSFGSSAGGAVTASINALTTARASTDAIGLNTAGTNVTWTANSSGLSFNGAGYAGTGSTFNGANISGSMTHNSAGLNLSLSAAAPGGGGGAGLSAGTQSVSTGTVNFANSNGISFGMSNSNQITASYTVPTQTVQPGPQNVVLGGNTSGTLATISSGTMTLAGGSNITLYQSGNSVQIVGQTNPTLTVYAGSNTIPSANTSGSMAANFFYYYGAGAASVGMLANVVEISVPFQSVQPAIGLNTAGTNVTWTANSSGLSFNGAGYAGTGSTFNGANISGSMTHNSAGLNLSLSAAAPGAGGGVAIGDGAANITNGTAVFSDLNGVSFGVNGSTMTASVAAQSNQTMGFTATGNTTYNSTGTFDARSIIVQGDGAVSVGLSNGSLVISANAGGGANPVHSFYQNLVPQNSAQPYTTLALVHRTMLMQPLSPIEGYGFPGDMTVSTFMMQLSASGTASSSYSSAVSIGLYLLANSSLLTLVNSASTSWSRPANAGNSTFMNGARYLTFHSSLWSTTPALSYGERYWYGVIHNSTNYSANGAAWLGQYVGASTQRSGTIGVSQANQTSQGMVPFLGVYSASLTSVPVSVGNSDVNKVNVSAGFVPSVILNATISMF